MRRACRIGKQVSYGCPRTFLEFGRRGADSPRPISQLKSRTPWRRVVRRVRVRDLHVGWACRLSERLTGTTATGSVQYRERRT